jgi:tetratricopeptide (TPR) repeat protein
MVVGGTALSVAGALGWGGAWVASVGGAVAIATGLHLSWIKLIEPMRERRALLAADADWLRAVLLQAPEPVEVADPDVVGVFRSALANKAASSVQPPYVERDIDDLLDQSLREMHAGGGLIAVRGDPKAGKSRTLWEALRRNAGSRTVYALRPPLATGADDPEQRPLESLLHLDLAAIGSEMVVWVDDAHEHFQRGLTNSNLRRLSDRYPGVIVAMTLHSHRLSANVSHEIDRPLVERLRVASENHQLRLRLSAGELARARQTYPSLANDEEIERLPGWFAAVDLLRARYKDFRLVEPNGIAVAKAAMDWRRAGMPTGITRTQLRELATIELDELPASRPLTKDAFHRGLEWACHEVAPWAALVRPLSGTRHSRFTDFDAVTSWVVTVDGLISERVWSYILTQVTPETRRSTGHRALLAGQYSFVESVWTSLGDSEDPEESFDAIFGLGVMFEGQGRYGEAESAYRRIVESGRADSVAWALGNLGPLLGRLGRIDEAETVFDRLINNGHPEAAPLGLVDLGRMLEEQGRVDEAFVAYERAMNQSDIDAMARASLRIAKLLESSERYGEAEVALQRVLSVDLLEIAASALLRLGSLYEKQGRIDEAQSAYGRAVDAGYRWIDNYPDAAALDLFRLGNLLREHGRWDDAETAYRRAIDTRHPDVGPKAAINLANQLRRSGRIPGAMALYQTAAESGHDSAAEKGQKGLRLIDQLENAGDAFDFYDQV